MTGAPDLVTVGRVTMDLLSQDVGVPFEAVRGFDTSVGGSPTNIAIASARLGLRSVAFTGVGDDLVGGFVLRSLRDEGVDTSHVIRVAGKRTSLALVAVQPPDRFPLTFYREDPADIHVTVADAERLPLDTTRATLLSGTAFSRGSGAAAAWAVAERARAGPGSVYIDLDLRPSEWTSPADFGRTLREVLPSVGVVIGTEDECRALVAEDADATDPARHTSAERADLEERLQELVAAGRVEAVVLKRGPGGASVFRAGGRLDVPGMHVEAVNTVGAGDAFAAGLIRSRLAGLGWAAAVRFANACGAIQVTRHGCSAVFPRAPEVEAVLAEHGEQP